MPHPLEDAHEVGTFAAEVSRELAERGHRVLLLAPSRSPQLVRESRKAIRAARHSSLFAADGGVRVLGVGQLDFVHVHEPWPGSAGSAALRHSRALNVGSFHAPAERVLSTQVARRFVETFFGRLDARTASFEATRELLQRAFPANYRLLRPGAALVDRPPRDPDAPLRILFCDHEERSALRLFLRALRRLPGELAWTAAVL